MTAHPDWLRPEDFPAGVRALMTTRRGGHGLAPFDSMNLQLGGGDAPETVASHRSTLAQALGATPVFLQQVHGTRVVRLGREHLEGDAPTEEADASVTTIPGLACTVLVADCLPVLLASQNGRAVGAAHAGWRGLAGGVLEATARAVCTAADCGPEEVQAWLGAAIGPSCFQVGPDVLAAFGGEPGRHPENLAPAARELPGFVPEQPGKWLADLPFLARRRLAAAGITRVSGGSWCTVSDPSRFFSYRRDGVTGRMAAAICLGSRG